MNSNYVHGNTGLSGLSGTGITLSMAEKSLFERDMKREIIPVIQSNPDKFSLLRAYKRSVGSHKAHKPYPAINRMYQDTFNGSAEKAYEYAIEHYKDHLISKGVYTPPINATPEPSPSAGSGNGESPQTTTSTKAGTNWLGWGVGLAVLGGAAWYFNPDEKKKSKN